MKISSADFMRLSLQEVADLLIEEDKMCACCKGFVDGAPYDLIVKLIEGDLSEE